MTQTYSPGGKSIVGVNSTSSFDISTHCFTRTGGNVFLYISNIYLKLNPGKNLSHINLVGFFTISKFAGDRKIISFLITLFIVEKPTLKLFFDLSLTIILKSFPIPSQENLDSSRPGKIYFRNNPKLNLAEASCLCLIPCIAQRQNQHRSPRRICLL